MLRDRRAFLRELSAVGLAAAGCGPGSRSSGTGWSPGAGQILVSARGTTPDTFGLVAWAEHGPPRTVGAAFRGHDVAPHPSRPHEVLLFGRRPGFETRVIDLDAGRATARLVPPPGRAFQGHGCFTRDGATLFTSEADVESGAGRIGVWDATTWQRLDELDTHGIGPHQIDLLPDGGALVVANGGLLTRPETGRRVLNLDTMDSTLAYLDPGGGSVLDVARVREPKASIRHFDIAPDGTVAFGVQVQRDATGHDRVVPLAGTHRRGEPVMELGDRLDVTAVFRDYVGSVAVGSGVAGFTSPRGNVVAFWDLDQGHFIAAHELTDVCGLTASLDGSRFIASSSIGEVRVLRPSDGSEVRAERRRDEAIAWDNHLRVLRGWGHRTS
jgi:hypothetical protein